MRFATATRLPCGSWKKRRTAPFTTRACRRPRRGRTLPNFYDVKRGWALYCSLHFLFHFDHSLDGVPPAPGDGGSKQGAAAPVLTASARYHSPKARRLVLKSTAPRPSKCSRANEEKNLNSPRAPPPQQTKNSIYLLSQLSSWRPPRFWPGILWLPSETAGGAGNVSHGRRRPALLGTRSSSLSRLREPRRH